MLRRRGAPTAEIWRAEPAAVPGFVLNLPAFHEPGVGFDISGFASAVDLAVTALTLIAPSASRIGIAMTDLDGLLAALGLDYDERCRPGKSPPVLPRSVAQPRRRELRLQ